MTAIPSPWIHNLCRHFNPQVRTDSQTHAVTSTLSEWKSCPFSATSRRTWKPTWTLFALPGTQTYSPCPKTSQCLRSNSQGHVYFTTLDERHGYWQVPLSDSTKSLTTFITPWGKIRLCRNPEGLISAGDMLNSRTGTALDRLTNCVKVVDVRLLHDTELSAYSTHFGDALLRAHRLHLSTYSTSNVHIHICDLYLNSSNQCVLLIVFIMLTLDTSTPEDPLGIIIIIIIILYSSPIA